MRIVSSPALSHAERNKKVRFVLAAILIANWIVALAKVIAGATSNLASVTADGLHSFIDGGSNVLGLVAMSIAARPADEDHPYGHGKFEALASLDGAIVMDRHGRLLAAGAILRHPAEESEQDGEVEGARTTAALAASRFGPVLKVSEDGIITFFDGERVWDI